MPLKPFLKKEMAPSGFSLVELMVAIVVVGIFMGAVFALFTNFLGESGEQAALSKRGFDTRMGLNLVRGDLANTGFGIAQKDVGGAIAGNQSSITIRSTAVHSVKEEAGQHGFVQQGGNVGNGMGGVIDSSEPGVAMTPDRDFLWAGQRGSLPVSEGNLFFVGRQGGSTTYYYERTYELSSPCAGNACGECAPGTPNLHFDDVSDTPEGVINCVVDFRLRYGFEQTGGNIQFTNDPDSPPASVVDTVPDLLKAAMVVQKGQDYRRTVSPATLSYTDPDFGGVTVNLSNAQQRYHWQILEWSVPLENLQ